MRLLAKSLTAVATFSSNVLFLRESTYWSLANEFKPLVHTWSLAVEEQFYLCYPIALIGIYRLWKSKILIGLIIITACSFFISLFISETNPEANFYLLPSRIWELTLGGIIAIIQLHYPRNYQQITSGKLINVLFSLLGISMIFFSFIYLDESFSYPGIWTLLPNLGTAMIIVFSNDQNLVSRFLGRKAFVHVGLISYSAYLWHQPLFAFMRYAIFPAPSVGHIMVALLMIYPLSVLSWKFVEQVFRDQHKISRSSAIIILATGCLLLVSVGLLGYYTQGFPNRSVVKNLRIKNYVADNRVLHEQSWQPLQEKTKETSYTKAGNQSDHLLWFDQQDPRRKVLLVGNSHSKDLYNVLMASDHFNQLYQLARYGTEIKYLGNIEHTFYDSPNYRAADVIMITSRYGIEDLDNMNMIIQKLQMDKKLTVIVENIHEFEQFGIHTIADFYVQKANLKDDGLTSIKGLADEINKVHYHQYTSGPILPNNLKIRELIKENDKILILDRMQYICDHPTQKCFAINNELEKYFYDYGHHTLAGAQFFGQRIDSIRWLAPLDSMIKIRNDFIMNYPN